MEVQEAISTEEGVPDTLHACSWRDRNESVLVIVTVTEGCWEFVEEITPLGEVKTKSLMASME